MPINPKAHFKAAGFNVIEVAGHNFKALHKALAKALKSQKPVLILAKTIMGQGSNFMQPEGQAHRSTWHGKAPKPQDIEQDLEALRLSETESKKLNQFLKRYNRLPKLVKEAKFFKPLAVNSQIKVGKPRLYTTEILTDNRSAYGNALLDLAKANKSVVALTADLEGSVKTNILKKQYPNRHFEVGIAEQSMVSISGGASLEGLVPFCSTFGAFMSSRAKDQARVNDINLTNVKMVATHCGLSVGEDGPTHQSLDDVSSFLGFFNTAVIEPADPNQTDRIIRYVASHFGNFYVRMGRHKYPVILKSNGQPYFDEKYIYKYGKADQIRQGSGLVIASSGGTLYEAVQAADKLAKAGVKVSVWNVPSVKAIDKKVLQDIQKIGKLIVVQDHNPLGGLAHCLESQLFVNQVAVSKYKNMAVNFYQLSDTQANLYKKAKINSDAIYKQVVKMLKK